MPLDGQVIFRRDSLARAKEDHHPMTAARSDVEDTFLARTGKPVDALTDDLPLYSDGIGLDSLETAELSAMLEDTHGTDPFQSDTMPQTVGDILRFYDGAAAQA
jgi:acyl carrier protein